MGNDTHLDASAAALDGLYVSSEWALSIEVIILLVVPLQQSTENGWIERASKHPSTTIRTPHLSKRRRACPTVTVTDHSHCSALATSASVPYGSAVAPARKRMSISREPSSGSANGLPWKRTIALKMIGTKFDLSDLVMQLRAPISTRNLRTLSRAHRTTGHV